MSKPTEDFKDRLRVALRDSGKRQSDLASQRSAVNKIEDILK